MAVVTKILETTLQVGSTSVVFTDSDIPNSLLRIYTTNSALFPASMTLENNSLTVTFGESQNTAVGVAVEIVKTGLSIIDDVTSDDADSALSAKQGKYLKGLIDNIPTSYDASDISYDNTESGITSDDVQGAIDEVFQYVSDGKTLIAAAITDKGVETSASDSFATMATNIENISSGGGGKVYLIATSSTGGGDASVRVKIFENGDLLSNTNYVYKQMSGQWRNLSDTLRLGYNVGGLSYSWKLEVKSGKVYNLGSLTQYTYAGSNILIDNWQYNTSRTFYLVDN